MPERGYFEQRLGAGRLEVGRPAAPEEREADATADRIMRTPPAAAAGHDGVRGTESQSWVTSGEADRSARAMMPGGAPLAPSARKYFEPRFGQDLGHVRIHTGPAAAASAQALGARAFALGPDIAFAAGQYAPERREGRRLLAHELAHVARRHTGLRRDGPAGMPQSEGGVTVTLVATADPLARYAGLRDTLGLEGWEALNDAARLRDVRQNKRRNQPPGRDEQQLATAARDTLSLPLAKLLQPRPYTEFGQFRELLFGSLRAGLIGQGAASIEVRDEIARRWASRHEAIVRGDVEVRLVDPQGELHTADELLFLIAGQPVTTMDGQLWITAVDAAVSPGDLAGIVQEVNNDANEVAEAVNLANESQKLTDLAQQMRQKPHEEVAGNDAEAMSGVLTELQTKVQGFATAHAMVSQLLAPSSNALTGEGTDFKSWLEAHRKFLAEHQPKKNLPEEEYERTESLMKAANDAPWYLKGFVGQAASQSAMAHGPVDLFTGGAFGADVELRRQFRAGNVSLKGFEEGESAIRDRGIIVGSVNAVVFVATLGLGAVIEPVSLGGQMAFGGISSMVGTGVVLSTQSYVTSRTTLSDPLAQQIWSQGKMSPGDIALSSLGAGLFGAATAGVTGWLSRGPNAALARQLVAESVQEPTLVRTLGPGLTARAVGPGVVEVTQAGQPGVMRFTLQGWELTAPGPGAAPQTATGTWTVPMQPPTSPVTGPVSGIGAFQFTQPGALPMGVAVGEQGWVVLGPGGAPVGTGAWGAPMATDIGGLPGLTTIEGVPVLRPAGGAPIVLPGGRSPLALPPPKGSLFVDIQGGPAVRPDTGQPTFLPSLVAGTPGARGFLLEPGDYIPGYSGISTINPRDLAMTRLLAQNMPQWPVTAPGVPGQAPLPWQWDPTLAFPTQGPVQVLTTPGLPGTTPVPQAFFPPIGGDVVPGVPRLIPIATGGRTAQQDVTGLQPSTHPELHGQVDRAYWRRPFALASADANTTAAMGKEVAKWLKPGGFLELRLLRGGEVAQALAIAAQIPDSRMVIVPRGAIAAYARTGQRPPGLLNEQWGVLEQAGPDIRGEFGALGQGQFASIVRIIRGTGSMQRVLVVGAEQPEEFDWAAGLQASGQDVTVVNPRTTAAARQFRQGGGNLLTGTVESLPPQLSFNTIREDFPFPLGRAFQPTRDFAMARISRLLPGGRWVVVTEASEFATTLEAAVTGLDVDVTRTTAPLAHEATPTSPWLPETSQERFMLVFTRRRQR
jgi:hypothetical protein